METKVIKITKETQVTYYVAECKKCGKEIIGSTENQVLFNLNLHKDSKRCKNE